MNDAPTAPVSELLRVRPPVDLAAVDPRGTPGLPDGKAVRRDRKGWARAALADLGTDLGDLQTRLYASAVGGGDSRRVLLVLQAMDCGGKDGATKAVARTMNPLGMHIVAFGPPTREELAHHFLWRIERALPPAGYLGVFNRSHYEDVLVARVRGLVPRRSWQARYDEINAFEESLVTGGLTLVKVMLHISYEEQRQRLLDRLNDPTRYWKYDPQDVEERARWAEYQAAYRDMLERCSTDHAPWYVVPADRKWYRNWALAHLLVEALRTLGLEYPPPRFDLSAERERVANAA